MNFDPENEIVKLCADGIMLEGAGKPTEAMAVFSQAWSIATTDFEKFTAAHYVARHQPTIEDKLKWDQIAVHHALLITDDNFRQSLPSLYLNVAKCYEDLHQNDAALVHYELAWSFTGLLPHDGYGEMIKRGIQKGIERVRA